MWRTLTAGGLLRGVASVIVQFAEKRTEDIVKKVIN
jgi:hypothetical protein